MRGFAILCTFFALAAAAPQQGYQYQAQAQDSQSALSGEPSHMAEALKDLQTVMTVQSDNLGANFQLSAQPQSISLNSEQNAVGKVVAAASLSQPQARYLAAALPAVNTLKQQLLLPQQVQQLQQQQTSYQQQIAQQPQQIVLQQQTAPQQYLKQQKPNAEPMTVITKRFYLHTAPEDAEEVVQERHFTVGKPRKNYNVVFIKTADKAAKKASIKITPAVNEEKTVIYVLNKKQDATDVDVRVNEPATTTNKPEVFFIKYKTAEEAAHAQKTIQAQYETLGGSTQVSNEGVAPSTSVINSLEAAKQTKSATGDNNEVQNLRSAQAEKLENVPSLVMPTGVQGNGENLSTQQRLSQSANASNAYLPPLRYYYR